MSTMVPSEHPPIDLDALRVMLGGDENLVSMILEKFRAEVLGDIEQLKSLQTGEQTTYSRISASLKGNLWECASHSTFRNCEAAAICHGSRGA